MSSIFNDIQKAVSEFNTADSQFLAIISDKNSQKHITTKKVSFIGKILMYFGWHGASMKKVINYLQQNAAEVEKLDDNLKQKLKEKVDSYVRRHHLKLDKNLEDSLKIHPRPVSPQQRPQPVPPHLRDDVQPRPPSQYDHMPKPKSESGKGYQEILNYLAEKHNFEARQAPIEALLKETKYSDWKKDDHNCILGVPGRNLHPKVIEAINHVLEDKIAKLNSSIDFENKAQGKDITLDEIIMYPQNQEDFHKKLGL